MNRNVRRAATVFVGLAAMIGLTITPSQAATPDSAAIAACGSSYYVQERFPINGGNAMTFLLYSSSTKNNCAVTLKDNPGTGNYGYPSYVSASIIASGGSWNTNAGDFRYYAGPVYVYAPGKCVKVRGEYDAWSNGSNPVTRFSVESGWVRCG